MHGKRKLRALPYTAKVPTGRRQTQQSSRTFGNNCMLGKTRTIAKLMHRAREGHIENIVQQRYRRVLTCWSWPAPAPTSVLARSITLSSRWPPGCNATTDARPTPCDDYQYLGSVVQPAVPGYDQPNLIYIVEPPAKLYTSSNHRAKKISLLKVHPDIRVADGNSKLFDPCISLRV